MGTIKYFFPRTKDYKEDADSYKNRILKMGKMKTVEKTRKIKKVKTRKRDNFKHNVENDDVDYNDNVCEDIGKVREMKIGQEDEERDSFKDNNDVDYNDDEYEDIGKVRKIKIGQEDDEDED